MTNPDGILLEFDKEEYLRTLTFALCTGTLEDGRVYAGLEVHKILVSPDTVTYEDTDIYRGGKKLKGDLENERSTVSAYVTTWAECRFRMDVSDELHAKLFVARERIIEHGECVEGKKSPWLYVLVKQGWTAYYVFDSGIIVFKLKDNQCFVYSSGVDDNGSLMYDNTDPSEMRKVIDIFAGVPNLKVLPEYVDEDYALTLLYALCVGDIEADSVIATARKGKRLVVYNDHIDYDNVCIFSRGKSDKDLGRSVTKYRHELREHVYEWFDKSNQKLVPTNAIEQLKEASNIIEDTGRKVSVGEKVWFTVLTLENFTAVYVPSYQLTLYRFRSSNKWILYRVVNASICRLITQDTGIKHLYTAYSAVIRHGKKDYERDSLEVSLMELCKRQNILVPDQVCTLFNQVCKYTLDGATYESLVNSIHDNFM